ncbi:hypothetical protein B4W73_09075 [Staphylococcus delphini]|nr:hypothetical protein B4W73_09075 [Staphylococcus delphini]
MHVACSKRIDGNRMQVKCSKGAYASDMFKKERMQVTCSKRSVCMWSVQKGNAYDMFKKSEHNHQMNLDINHQKCYNMSYEN